MNTTYIPPPRFRTASSLNPATGLPMDLAASKNENVANGPKHYPTRATTNKICLFFLQNRCSYGERCCHIHIRPTESQPTPFKTPLNPASKPSTVLPMDQYVVKLPNRFQVAGNDETRLASQSPCIIDLTDDSRAPIVRLRRSDCPPTNPSQKKRSERSGKRP
ncbi:hypothetical protein B0H13DRAFT_1040256 [Mycena leptocephala]|nr:hypothetical protein B0H13DRAFT_1040256 [Mycena leptocephala]